MPIWPFKRRRSKAAMKDSISQPLREKSQSNAAVAATSTAPDATIPTRTPSKRSSSRKLRRRTNTDEKAHLLIDDKRLPISAADKENLAHVQSKSSIEDITALPISWKLQHSPHLRPVDLDRPQIPYNFRQHATSETSVPRTDAPSSRPQTLRSKRSIYDNGTQRRRSSKKRKDDQVREEEIRAMSASIPIPPRPGNGPLRRDSYKRRTTPGKKDSTVSLPRQETLHSSMSFVIEQRGWEVNSFGVFNPRPAIRLSSTPQYPSPFPPTTAGDIPASAREKGAQKRDTKWKRQAIGADADELDSSDLRLALERDAKRREKRKLAQQEKLDRKLRARAGKAPADVGKKHRDDEDDISKAQEAELAKEAMPRDMSSIHPALRDEPYHGDDAPGFGLGIESSKDVVAGADRQHDINDSIENPFRDPTDSPTTEARKTTETTAPLISPLAPTLESPFEDPLPQIQRPNRMSFTSSPAMSPIDRSRTGSMQPIEQKDVPPLPTSPPPDRRASESRERRTGSWATFFKRSSTSKKTESASTTSFANTSRESMGRQPIPPHLITQRESPFQRTKSGAPARTQSRFREDLPELPMSPPDSRVQSPDLPVGAGAALAARRSEGPSTPIDIAGGDNRARDSGSEVGTGVRSDTPISPARGRGLISASMASVDSEGSWLASGSGNRASVQSGLSRSMGGSINKRTTDVNASFEDLGAGGDKDAEYVHRTAQLAETRRALHGRKISSSALASAGPDEESEYGETQDETTSNPLTMHESARRRPTLVHRDPAVRSREGLLADYSVAEGAADDSIAGADDADADSSEHDSSEGTRFESARSIDFAKGHVRHVSAGSARLLDLASNRRSSIPSSPHPHQTRTQMNNSQPQ